MRLVFVHGPLAAGKLTTARALERLVGYPVFHNHLVVDTLATVFPFGSEPFVRLRERFWLDVFADAARTGRSLIFTFAPESTVSAGFPQRARAAVEQHGGTVHFVRLDVDESEQERRVAGDDRRAFGKVADVETLRRVRDREPAGLVRPPADLVVDTGESPADETARAIVAAFGLTRESPVEPFPNP
ncbi:MAG: hypothetical protein QM626_14780 [Microbacterium sp.]|uniref:AAA family ATPase n=1 Tax=Microbacterium sp. TaxID=51671 RepID=UPI0039E21615